MAYGNARAVLALAAHRYGLDVGEYGGDGAVEADRVGQHAQLNVQYWQLEYTHTQSQLSIHFAPQKSQKANE